MIYWRNVSLGFVKLANHAGDSPVASRWRIDPLFALKAVNIRLSMVIHLCVRTTSREAHCSARGDGQQDGRRRVLKEDGRQGQRRNVGGHVVARIATQYCGTILRMRPAAPGSVSSCTRRRSMLAGAAERRGGPAEQPQASSPRARAALSPRRARPAAALQVAATASALSPLATPQPLRHQRARGHHRRPLTRPFCQLLSPFASSSFWAPPPATLHHCPPPRRAARHPCRRRLAVVGR